MIETPSVAFRQSSRDRRSPMINSTFLPAGKRSSASFKRGKRLDGRTKQRRLAKPYSRSLSTTFEPIKPLDPVTRMRSPGEAIYSKLIPRADFSFQVLADAPATAAIVNRSSLEVARSSSPQRERLWSRDPEICGRCGRRRCSAYQRMRVSVGCVTGHGGIIEEVSTFLKNGKCAYCRQHVYSRSGTNIVGIDVIP